MQNFEFHNHTKIIFGKKTEEKVGEEIKQYGKNILLHYGNGSIKANGLYKTIINSLEEQGIRWIELGGVVPNPRLELVKEGIDICRKKKIDCILAVGGGSVIDSAKAIGAGACYTGEAWEMFFTKNIKQTLPVGVILTIPSAGSETSGRTVITKEDEKCKQELICNVLRPVFAILNPETTYSLTPYQTATGIMDIMAHIMTRYFTSECDVDLTDRLCEATMKTVIENAPRVIKYPFDYAARAEIMWAGTVAQNDLLGAGRREEWVCHDIENQLSAMHDINHGAGLSIIFPAWMKYVYKYNKQRFAQFAHRVWDVGDNYHDLEDMALEGINRMELFLKIMGLPTRLSHLNIDSTHFDTMARNCLRCDKERGSFVQLKREDIINIFNIAM